MNIKRVSISVVILALALFTIISLLAIWDVITDGDLVWKSLTSLAVIGFAGLVGVALGDRIKM
jgi:hypothetical protein